MTSRTRRGCRLLALLTLFAVVAAPSSAQTELPPEALVGSRVRVKTLAAQSNTLSLTGVVVGIDGPNLVVDPSQGPQERRVVPIAAIDRLDVHRGRGPATKDGLIAGAIVVGVAGGAFGWLVGALRCDGVADCNAVASQAGGIAAGMAVGGLVGAGIGAGVGSLFTKDLWEPARLRRTTTGLSVQPVRGGVGIALSVRF
jgi:hypothetical protein